VTPNRSVRFPSVHNEPRRAAKEGDPGADATDALRKELTRPEGGEVNVKGASVEDDLWEST